LLGEQLVLTPLIKYYLYHLILVVLVKTPVWYWPSVPWRDDKQSGAWRWRCLAL